MTANLKSRLPSCLWLLALVPGAGLLAADRMTVVSEGDLAKEWIADSASPRRQPGIPASIAQQAGDACVSIGYLLNKDGTTSDFTMLKSWSANSPQGPEADARIAPLGQAAVAAVQGWRFVPAPGPRGKRKPVYTAATFAFASTPGSDGSALQAHCAIGNLPAFIATAQSQAYRRGNLQKGRLDRDRIENPATISGH